MRSIKFRVWSNEGQTMLKWEELLEAADFVEHMKYSDEPDAYYSPLMQFTGLVDRNGKEIYEGDILGRKSPNTGDTFYYKIVWESENARFMAVGKTIQEPVYGALERGYEWAGNIYEHPHLLEVPNGS